MSKIILIISLLIVYSCTTLVELKETKKVYSSKLKDDVLYQRALVYLSKATGDIKKSIRLKDKKKKHIISKNEVTCIRKLGLIDTNLEIGADFILDIKIKNSKFLISLEDISFWSRSNSRPKTYSNKLALSRKEREKLEACVKKLPDNLEKHIVSNKTDDWSF